jgi:phosphate transport system substrate-binding protein
MHISKKIAAPLAALALGLTVAACGGDDNESTASVGGGAQNLSGNVTIDGSSTVQPFAEAATELFNEQGNEVNAAVRGSGTGDGFEKFCRGETDISTASRAIEADEEDACEKGGVAFTEIQVANDGITVVSNKGTAIDCLTTDQLKDIFGPDAKAAKYNEVDPKLPDQEIALFTPGGESGTYDFFTDEINGEEGVQRKGDILQTSSDDNQLVTGVSGQEGAIGYFGFSFYEQNADKLNAIGVDAGDGCVKPSKEAIADGSYQPLARPLFYYVSNKALARPEVKGFVEYSVDSSNEIAEASKIVPMSPEQLAESKQAIASSAR